MQGEDVFTGDVHQIDSLIWICILMACVYDYRMRGQDIFAHMFDQGEKVICRMEVSYRFVMSLFALQVNNHMYTSAHCKFYMAT